MDRSPFGVLSQATVILCLFLGACSRSPELPVLEEYVHFKMERDHMPGLAIAVVKGDRTVWSKGFGSADLEGDVPVTGETVFGTASITKSFTAAAVFQLQEQGKLDIDDPVDLYLPFSVRSSWQPEAVMTIRQVLAHTSGISNGPSLWRIIGCGDSPHSLEEWAKGYFLPDGAYWHQEGNFERWEPDSGFQYSNAGYGLLAYIVELVSGEPFPDYIRAHLLEPLDMGHASLRVSELDTAQLTRMYEWGELWGFEYDIFEPGQDTSRLDVHPRYIALCAYNDPVLGAGSLYSSAEELSHFLIMIRNRGLYNGRRILNEESVREMFSPLVSRDLLPPWFVDLGMGGYAMRLDNELPVWGHTGADPGMSSFMFFNRSADLGVVVLANRFFDIRDLISWTYAEGFREFGDYSLVNREPEWSLYCGESAEGPLAERRLVVEVIAEHLPDGDQLYINGSHHRIGGWISRGMPLAPQPDGRWRGQYTFFDSTRLAFRITRGSWATKEARADGSIPGPHQHQITGDTTLVFRVAQWQDLAPARIP